MNELVKAANAGEYSSIKREPKRVTLGIPEDIIIGHKEVKGVQYPTVYWDKLRERFPMTWVHCVDFHVDSEDVEVCTVISMCKDCEVNRVMQDLRRAGYGCSSRRTTEMEMDFLYGND